MGFRLKSLGFRVQGFTRLKLGEQSEEAAMENPVVQAVDGLLDSMSVRVYGTRITQGGFVLKGYMVLSR